MDTRKKKAHKDLGDLQFKQLYREFQPKILRYLKRLLGDHDAEDLCQEVFLKISRSLKRFQHRSRWSTWIYRIATNLAVDKIRASSSRHAKRPDSLGNSTEIGDWNPWTGEETLSPEARMMLKEMDDCFLDFIDRVPANYRTVFILSELEGFSNSKIAAILGLSLATVKIRLHRGRSILYQELRTHCRPEEWPFELIRK